MINRSDRAYRYHDLGAFQPNLQHLALYQPSADAFFLTLSDSDSALARKIKQLMSGRYDLFVCRLDTAQNHQPNLIDNDCCFAWSLENALDLPVTRPYDFHSVWSVTNLIPRADTYPTDKDHLLEQQQYMHMIKFWLGFVTSTKGLMPWYDHENFMSQVISAPPQGSRIHLIHDIEKLILKSCYHGRHYEPVDQSIRLAISHDEFLTKVLYEWEKDNLS